jgi:hypothetical protein
MITLNDSLTWEHKLQFGVICCLSFISLITYMLKLLFLSLRKHVFEANSVFPWEFSAFISLHWKYKSPCFVGLWGHRFGNNGHPGTLAASLPHNVDPFHVFCSCESCALSLLIVAVITQMICSTVTSSQRCHLKLKIHVKSREATFKQTVRPDLVLQCFV